jgi:digeranylgeranylglycerophospholipid reductase
MIAAPNAELVLTFVHLALFPLKMNNASRRYDIIVVGAGPAGSIAATSAATEGRSVCLIERKPIAGYPVRCGEGIGYKGAAFNNFPIEERWIKSRIRRIRLIAPNGTLVEVNQGAESYILDREVMDLDLVHQAVACGVEYHSNTTIQSIRSIEKQLYVCTSASGDFYSPIVILAEGVESRLARAFGWNTTLKPEDVETCAFCRVKHDSIIDDACTFFVGSEVTSGGYAWVFPRGNKEANVGLGVLGSYSNAGLPKRLLEQFVRRLFPGAAMINIRCGGVPAGAWTRPLVKDGIMLAGDAARQVISLTGAGINYAIYAGKLAGKIAAQAIEGNVVNYQFLKTYEHEWAKGLGKQQMRSYALKNFLIKKHDDRFLNSIAQSLTRKRKKPLSVLGVFLRAFITNPIAFVRALLLFR